MTDRSRSSSPGWSSRTRCATSVAPAVGACELVPRRRRLPGRDRARSSRARHHDRRHDRRTARAGAARPPAAPRARGDRPPVALAAAMLRSAPRVPAGVYALARRRGRNEVFAGGAADGAFARRACRRPGTPAAGRARGRRRPHGRPGDDRVDPPTGVLPWHGLCCCESGSTTTPSAPGSPGRRSRVHHDQQGPTTATRRARAGRKSRRAPPAERATSTRSSAMLTLVLDATTRVSRPRGPRRKPMARVDRVVRLVEATLTRAPPRRCTRSLVGCGRRRRDLRADLLSAGAFCSAPAGSPSPSARRTGDLRLRSLPLMLPSAARPDGAGPAHRVVPPLPRRQRGPPRGLGVGAGPAAEYCAWAVALGAAGRRGQGAHEHAAGRVDDRSAAHLPMAPSFSCPHRAVAACGAGTSGGRRQCGWGRRGRQLRLVVSRAGVSWRAAGRARGASRDGRGALRRRASPGTPSGCRRRRRPA